MSRLEPPELRRLVHDCVPRMIVALDMPRSLGRALAERRCSAAAMRQRLIFVHDESWLVAKRCTEAHELAKAERAEQLATVAGLLALVLETRGRDSEQADELLDRALAICTSWMVGELAVQPTKPSRVIEGLSSLRTRWLAGRRKPSVA